MDEEGKQRVKRHRGFSLIEVLLVVVLLAVLMLAMASAFTAIHVATQEARMLQLAKHIAQLKLEEVLGDPLPQVGTFQDAAAGFPGFRTITSVSYPDDWALGGLEVVVSVSYVFLGGQRAFSLSAIYYAPLYEDWDEVGAVVRVLM